MVAHDGEVLKIHTLLFAVIGDHVESCMTSCTYETWNAKGPCYCCTLKRKHFRKVGMDACIPW